MSFHKRWLSEEKLRSIYNSAGITGLKTVLKADAFICEDKFSSVFLDICDKHSDDELNTNLTEYFNVSRIIS
jgi:hypothetical protein